MSTYEAPHEDYCNGCVVGTGDLRSTWRAWRSKVPHFFVHGTGVPYQWNLMDRSEQLRVPRLGRVRWGWRQRRCQPVRGCQRRRWRRRRLRKDNEPVRPNAGRNRALLYGECWRQHNRWNNLVLDANDGSWCWGWQRGWNYTGSRRWGRWFSDLFRWPRGIGVRSRVIRERWRWCRGAKRERRSRQRGCGRDQQSRRLRRNCRCRTRRSGGRRRSDWRERY
jgi:hypothetical protein